jgi:hypothetical protein
LTFTWTANPTPSQPINRFIGNITVDGDVVETINVSDSTLNYTVEDYQEEKTYILIICAENVNGRTCSTPRKINPIKFKINTTLPPPVPATTLSLATNTPTKITPGLIAAVAVIAAILLCCCLFTLILLCLCCWKVDREKSYWPGQSDSHYGIPKPLSKV